MCPAVAQNSNTYKNETPSEVESLIVSNSSKVESFIVSTYKGNQTCEIAPMENF